MRTQAEIVAKALELDDPGGFDTLALELFTFQYAENSLYREFCGLLGRNPGNVEFLNDIPFMPVEFFRDHLVLTGEVAEGGLVFRSSGTVGMHRSQHQVAEPAWYDKGLLRGFRHFFGDPESYHILALLPGYLERGDSSLVYMVRRLMEATGKGADGFYIDDFRKLHAELSRLSSRGERVMLIGVSYALLDFSENYPSGFPDLIVVETGGMKGRGRELLREDLHGRLAAGFGVSSVASEYGMTELLSQAWSTGAGQFRCPPWMRVMVRDIHDPFSILGEGRSGGINIIDLLNAGSCAFLATQDLGRLQGNGSFEVLGRFDHSDLRGCNLIYTG